MKIIRARISGFCMGVRRAVNMASGAVSLKKNIYTLGPLIHNSGVLKNLEQMNIRVLDDKLPGSGLTLIPENSAVIIRAHGIPPDLEKSYSEKGIEILDATCPHVKTSQKKASEYAGRGYCIFLAGEKDHAEIAGIRGYIEAAGQPANCGTFCVGSAAEAEKAAFELANSRPEAKTVLIGQTTIGPDEYSDIGTSVRRYFPNLEIIDSICGSTAERQQALRELCGAADAIIVAGGRESANTRRLYTLANDLGKPCWLLESPEEIPREIYRYENIGITAGASTPENLVDQIEKALLLQYIEFRE